MLKKYQINNPGILSTSITSIQNIEGGSRDGSVSGYPDQSEAGVEYEVEQRPPRYA